MLDCFRKILIHNGVINTPSILDILALKIAAGILPPAIETITTEDETVEGKAAKKKNGNHTCCRKPLWNKGFSRIRISGNKIKVLA